MYCSRSSTTVRSRPTRNRSCATRAARSSTSPACSCRAPACGSPCSRVTRCRSTPSSNDRSPSAGNRVARRCDRAWCCPTFPHRSRPPGRTPPTSDGSARRGRHWRPRPRIVRQQRQSPQGRRPQRHPDRRTAALSRSLTRVDNCTGSHHTWDIRSRSGRALRSSRHPAGWRGSQPTRRHLRTHGHVVRAFPCGPPGRVRRSPRSARRRRRKRHGRGRGRRRSAR